MKRITEGKVFKSIESYIESGKNKFIIYPYGKRGKLAERILKESFHIIDYVVADNYVKKENILTLNQLHGLSDSYVLLLCSDNLTIWQELRENLQNEFHGEICDLAEECFENIEYEPFCFAGSKMRIDEVNAEQTKRIFERTKKAWEKLGREEPYFSVVTHDQMRTENLTQETISQFFASGRSKTMELLASLKRHGIEQTDSLSVLELGCGCGRITRSFAQQFKHVVAVDISEGNLGIAKEQIDSPNVDFFLIKEVEDYMKLPKSDVIYSVIVLQHNCPSVIEYILNVMMCKVNPGGILMFQVPTYFSGYSFCYEEYIKRPECMEMHCFPQWKIFKLAHDNHCVPLEVYPYLCTGRQDHSTMFLFRKTVEG